VVPITNYGFVIDNRRCIGCHACTVACKAEHDDPIGVNKTWVKQIEKGEFPNTNRNFSVMRCNHCDDSPCTDVCPTTVLWEREDGIVDFDPERCIGCVACMQGCPYDALYIDPTGLLVGGGLGLLVGSWTGAPRLIKALSRDYSSLGPRRSIAALIPAFVIAQTAILLGIPVSFNEIIVSTIIGSGATAEAAGIGRRKITYTALAWAGSLTLALALGSGLYTAFTLL
jgi:phosphate/sulfate permease